MKVRGFNSELLKRILAYLSPFRKRLWVIAICFAFSTAIGFFKPLVIKSITDDGMMAQNMEIIIRAAMLLLALVVIENVVEIFFTRLFADIHNES